MADMEKVTGMLGNMVGEYTLMAGNFSSMKESIEERQKRNAELRARLDNMYPQAIFPTFFFFSRSVTRHIQSAK